MNNKKTGESRRQLLKSIAAGSSAVIAGKPLPESWSRPVVDSVLLPAHAQTSNNIFSSNNIAIAALEQTDDSMLAGFIDRLVPAAHAGTRPSASSKGCAMILGANVDFWLQILNGPILIATISGILPLSGTPVNVTFTTVCEGGFVIQALVTATTSAYVDITLDGDTVRFPVANACVSKSFADCV